MKRKTKKQSSAPQKVKTLEAKTENQKEYIRSIIENDVVFCSGPSGSGKSYIAAGIASDHLHRGEIEQVLISRPLVCTGKEIGSLPGDLLEKIAPYLLPMQENFRHFLGRAYYGMYYNEGRIKYQPLEVMRGSTFHNTYMILDEAQNCTFEQIKMFITRMGQGSKVLINGDTKQCDLSKSGLWDCIEKLKNVEGVGISTLTTQDIQRNGILGRILNAMEN
jgi:phosphate starvation-inducible PhoH-like protein|tara:strand:- start:392 stop:1051 length:660 start_codon:yes stop_codon:yes gene_type:complete